MVKLPPILNSVDYTEFSTYIDMKKTYAKQLTPILKLLTLDLYAIVSPDSKFGEQRILSSKVRAQQKQALPQWRTMAKSPPVAYLSRGYPISII